MQEPNEDIAAVVLRNYARVFGRPPNLESPTTFNEKIIYKMIHDRRPILTRLADKLRARDYVAERIGARYLTELYQVCRSPAEIAWARLPKRYAIKTNHGSGMHILVLDGSRIDVGKVSSQLDEWLRIKFHTRFGEWCYRDIEPVILIEELLTDITGALASDWKFYTFDGRAEFLAINLDQFSQKKVTFYDRRLVRQPLRRRYPNAPTDPKFPHNIELMFSLADEIGRGLDFIRVDLYNVGGRIVFGELTHYPDAGLGAFDPPEFDALYGSKWRLPARYE